MESACAVAELPKPVATDTIRVSLDGQSASEIGQKLASLRKRTNGGANGSRTAGERFMRCQLAQVRARLTELNASLSRLNAMPELTKGREAGIKAVSGAMKDLQEQERQLAGRPLPPTLKGEARLVAKTRAQQLLSGE